MVTAESEDEGFEPAPEEPPPWPVTVTLLDAEVILEFVSLTLTPQLSLPEAEPPVPETVTAPVADTTAPDCTVTPTKLAFVGVACWLALRLRPPLPPVRFALTMMSRAVITRRPRAFAGTTAQMEPV